MENEKKLKHKNIPDNQGKFMYEHGFFDTVAKKWFCSYFMNSKEWMEIHDYLPPSKESDLPDDDFEVTAVTAGDVKGT